MRILFIILLPIILLSSSYPNFTTNDFLIIEKESGRIAKNRTMDYQKKINSLKNSSRQRQLNVVNSYLNQLLPQYDAVIEKKRRLLGYT